MRKVMGVILSLLLLVGCSGPAQAEVPVSAPVQSSVDFPRNSDAISPAKVAISNFHLGAVAEYPMTLHSGSEIGSAFSVEIETAGYTASGYLKAPLDIMQEWILVADKTPILAGYETKDVLVTLSMPSSLKEDEISFYQVTDVGSSRLSELMSLAYKDTKTSIYNELLKKYPRASDIESSMVEERVTTALLNEAFYKYPESRLLSYLSSKASVSTKLLLKDGMDVRQVQEFLSNKYVVKGDLLKDKWEFWIGVRNTSTGGNVQTEMASRWLVSMRT